MSPLVGATSLAHLAIVSALLPVLGPVGAKVAFFADTQRPLPWKLKTGAQAVVVGLGLPIVALPFARRCSLALAFLAASLCVYASGLLTYQGQYVVILLPACLWALCAWPGSPKVRSVLLRACAIVAVAGVIQAHALMRVLTGITADNAAAVAWADRNLPHDQMVLVHDAGMSAYVSRLRLCDVVGLKTPTAVGVHQALTARRETDRGAAIAKIAAACRGRFAVVRRAPLWSDMVGDLVLAGWRRQLLRPAGAPGGYEVWRLTPPG